MRRREFITLLGGVAGGPFASRAQQSGRIYRIGVLSPGLDNPVAAAGYRAFVSELRDLGWIVGQNLIIEHRRTDQDAAEVSAAAAELVQLNAEVVYVSGPENGLKAAVAASRTIPIVMLAINYDPIERGYVAGLARPGGNVTGLFYRQPELAAKQLELLTQALPDRTRLAVMWDALSADQFAMAEGAANSLGLQLQSLKLENPPYDFDAAFRSAARNMAQMLLVLSTPFFTQHRARIAELAIENRLATMFIFKSYVEAGGLMSYGTDSVLWHRRAASYVAKILMGTKPADLPVEQPTKFDLVVNLKTAKALGITIPPMLLARANEVIE